MVEEKQNFTVYGSRQQLFIKYILLILIYLVVLGFFNQYWNYVFIETFTIALLTAILLQVLMQVANILQRITFLEKKQVHASR